MKFDWDPEKSTSNLEKHGMDFNSARRLWDDENRVEIEAPYPIESRYILIAKSGDKLWSAIYTYRDPTVRIISVRRARKKERELYEKEKTGQE